jgi:hypothetical protein
VPRLAHLALGPSGARLPWSPRRRRRGDCRTGGLWLHARRAPRSAPVPVHRRGNAVGEVARPTRRPRRPRHVAEPRRGAWRSRGALRRSPARAASCCAAWRAIRPRASAPFDRAAWPAAVRRFDGPRPPPLPALPPSRTECAANRRYPHVSTRGSASWYGALMRLAAVSTRDRWTSPPAGAVSAHAPPRRRSRAGGGRAQGSARARGVGPIAGKVGASLVDLLEWNAEVLSQLGVGAVDEGAERAGGADTRGRSAQRAPGGSGAARREAGR